MTSTLVDTETSHVEPDTILSVLLLIRLSARVTGGRRYLYKIISDWRSDPERLVMTRG